MMKAWMVAALVAASGTQAYAKDKGADPVTVEVIGTGGSDLRATAARLSVSYVARGKTVAAADAAKAQKEAAVLRLLTAEGVPATAVGPLSPTDQAKMALSSSLLTDMSDTTTTADASEESSGGRTIELSSAAQATAIAAKLKALGVQVGDPQPTFDSPHVAAARREARLAAVTDARAGADRYAAALGMHIGGLRRISETSAYGVLPGLQEKIGAIVATGGQGLTELMAAVTQPPKEVLKVEESVIAEFALLP